MKPEGAQPPSQRVAVLTRAAPSARKAPAKSRGKSKKRSSKAKKKRKPKRGSTDKGSGGKRVSLEDDFLIEGKLEKPSAYYILRRSQSDYDWARLDAKFLPLVLESVQDPLF